LIEPPTFPNWRAATHAGWNIAGPSLSANWQPFRTGARVLDFGAGSLRESFDLATRGFNVTSLDIDADVLASYSSRYNWPDVTKHRVIAAPDNLFDGLREIEGETFDLITAFDVLEHLDDPATALVTLCRHLTPTGKLFITVPNGRTLLNWRSASI